MATAPISRSKKRKRWWVPVRPGCPSTFLLNDKSNSLMEKKYSQWTAMWAICRASLRSVFRSPQAVFFSLFFPVVLIVVFGALSNGGGVSIDVAFDSRTDTANAVYQAISHTPGLDIVRSGEADLLDRLKKGRITALIGITSKDNTTNAPQYDVHLRTTSAGGKDLPVLQSILS